MECAIPPLPRDRGLLAQIRGNKDIKVPKISNPTKYFVNNVPFDDILDAITYCKERPQTKIVDSNGAILMEHVKVSYEVFRDIWVAKNVLDIQMMQ